MAKKPPAFEISKFGVIHAGLAAVVLLTAWPAGLNCSAAGRTSHPGTKAALASDTAPNGQIAAFTSKWGSDTVDDGDFSSPYALAVNSIGNVYVADTLNSRVQEFDYQGNFITAWGSEGSGNGQFIAPQAITIDSGGNVYVGDVERIEKFGSGGIVHHIVGRIRQGPRPILRTNGSCRGPSEQHLCRGLRQFSRTEVRSERQFHHSVGKPGYRRGRI